MESICAVDIGGTFTDCVLINENGKVTTEKTLTTHDEGIETGFFDSIKNISKKVDSDEEEIFNSIIRLAHGTTIATNMMVEDKGSKIGLITTKGHEDTVRMMLGQGRATGEPPENIFRVTEIEKPQPIVPENLIYSVSERVDFKGREITPLSEEESRQAVKKLIEEGVEGIAIVFLWSFKNPKHEERVREIIEEENDDIFVSCSHEISPRVGEYERSVATCINSIVGPGTTTYLDTVSRTLYGEHGFDNPFLLMKCDGGNAWQEEIANTPVNLIGSGPVGGLRACQRIGEELGLPNIIATDMGGTSFELGIIWEGTPLMTDETVIQKYQYNLPKLDIKSIGAGGGSIAYYDEDIGSMRVGPHSAGADPGPACYGLGGEKPTVTDADLLLGYIDPSAEMGEELALQKDLAREAIEKLATELGLTIEETARGIFKIINTKMANHMEREVIGGGFDPRDFAVIAYGGAGPIHVSSYARELGVDKVIVPSNLSPVWSAYGIGQSDISYEFEEETKLQSPFDPSEIEDKFDELEEEAGEVFRDKGVSEGDVSYHRMVDMRYREQVHTIEVSLPEESLEDEELEDLINRFQEEYERRFSPAARLEGAKEQIITLRITAEVEVEKFEREKSKKGSANPPQEARKSSRGVYMNEEMGTVEVPVFDGMSLRPGNRVDGPVIIDFPNTSVVAREGQLLSVNQYQDIQIEL